ncbi:MAG: DUF3618 domain-containing protein [Actinomycetales bacterium]|nr:DUF3618 domain-containing protein [Actinomycetales bacterium]
MSDNASQSVEQLQAEIEAARARLAGTIDELTFRAQPSEIIRRQRLLLARHSSPRLMTRTATCELSGSRPCWAQSLPC